MGLYLAHFFDFDQILNSKVMDLYFCSESDSKHLFFISGLVFVLSIALHVKY